MPINPSLSDNYMSDRCSFFRLVIGANIWFTAAHVPNLRSWPIYVPSFIYERDAAIAFLVCRSNKLIISKNYLPANKKLFTLQIYTYTLIL